MKENVSSKKSIDYKKLLVEDFDKHIKEFNEEAKLKNKSKKKIKPISLVITTNFEIITGTLVLDEYTDSDSNICFQSLHSTLNKLKEYEETINIINKADYLVLKDVRIRSYSSYSCIQDLEYYVLFTDQIKGVSYSLSNRV